MNPVNQSQPGKRPPWYVILFAILFIFYVLFD